AKPGRAIRLRLGRGYPALEMSSIEKPIDLTRAARILALRIRQAASGWRGGLLRCEVEIDRLDALEWLSAQRGDTKVYWRDRNGDFETAGIGIADAAVSAPPEKFAGIADSIERKLLLHTGGCRYYGGCRFDGLMPPDRLWSSFPNAWFVLPQVELVRRGDRAFLSCNLNPAGENAVVQLTDRLRGVREAVPEVPHAYRVLRHDRLPDAGEWSRMLKRTLDRIADGEMDKVVLANRITLELDRKADAWSLLRCLRSSGNGNYLFGFQPSPEAAFIGASPERLFRRAGREIETEAIAGTRRRGATTEEDGELAEDLLGSDKDRREQEMVTAFIRESLASLAASLDSDRLPSVLKLSQLQHLYTPVFGKLKEGVSDSSLLNALHPTPAVGGYPRMAALDVIRSLKSFDRGWYAGPVGWIGADACEFAVGIRSMLVRGNSLVLVAGAGIVDGSAPEEEWLEIEQKLKATLNAVLPS
ncbi:MAG TPA: isochorismate synthase, partial [Acidobacteriota bacterium]|nr:isochorismate synthase [Acidobacteriota bacterium]